MSRRPPPDRRVMVLEASRAERNYWADLWAYRELFFILAWRDLAVRYKQTAIGLAWALIRPAITIAILTVVFARLAKLPSEGAAPYALMVAVGMLAWTLISTILSEAANSLVVNANLVGKVYFPRLIVPGATTAIALADAGVAFVLILAMMAWFRFLPDWRVLFLPGFTLLAVLASLGPGLLMAAMNVKYRDFRYVVPFALQLGVYISPVGFSSSRVPGAWRLLYSANPAVGVIDGLRWCLLRGEAPFYAPGFFAGLVVTLALLAWGVIYFRRSERTFADVI